MNRQVRTVVYVVAALGVLALMGWAATGIDHYGHYPGPYGDEVARVALQERHATNAVTTVVMDIRAVDTAGEELILYAAAIGVLMLLRKQRREHETEAPEESLPDRAAVTASQPLRSMSSALIAPTVVFGFYLVTHGAITPGGGFQGGVVLAVPSILLLLAARYQRFVRLHRTPGWEITQAIAVSGFLAVGLSGLVIAQAFLANVLPYGVAATIYSAGTIQVLNVLAGVAVATAIVLIAIELQHQLVEVRTR